MDNIRAQLDELNAILPELSREYKKIIIMRILKPILEISLVIVLFAIMLWIYSLFFNKHLFTFSIVILSIVFLLKVFKISFSENMIGRLMKLSKEEMLLCQMSIVKNINYIYDMNDLYANGNLTEDSFKNTKYQILDGNLKLKKRNRN